MDQQTIMLASIGDLEVTRRQLILEIQARDERIKELEEQLGITLENDSTGNGQVKELIG